MDLHTYLSAVGYGIMTRQRQVDDLLDGIVIDAVAKNRIKIDENNPLPDGQYEAEVRKNLLTDSFGDAVGNIVIRGLYNPAIRVFSRQFYYPEITGGIFNDIETDVELERERDRDVYLVHCDSIGNELEPIFFLSNSFDFVKENGRVEKLRNRIVNLAGLSVAGEIILPINKTDEQKSRQNLDFKKRLRLVKEVRGGNENAASQLSLIDYSAIESICRRVQDTDLYSVVDTSFVPSGMECDTYKIIGNILNYELINCKTTGEKVYYLELDCNNERINVAINAGSLQGMPAKGFRFVGRVWLQGRIS